MRLLSAVNTSVPAEHEDFPFQSDYVVILSALFCALICVIGLAMVARCFCLHHRLMTHSSRAAPPPPPPPPRGLNQKTLQLMPTTKCVGGIVGNSSGDKQTDCAICLAEFADGDVMRLLPHCGHVFHVACIDTWLLSHSSCPSCRQLVVVASRCHHCGGFSAAQGFTGTEIDERQAANMMSRSSLGHFYSKQIAKNKWNNAFSSSLSKLWKTKRKQVETDAQSSTPLAAGGTESYWSNFWSTHRVNSLSLCLVDSLQNESGGGSFSFSSDMKVQERWDSSFVL